ncbi:ATP-binding protein [Nocardiopsis aegyptia]|uniref:histidine kinase n=1 Tax=Nocardiopsis aegyptia TaxID=220378 RepID=A0A7Z0EKI0_9ACTN|nr:ATP-binding protein [Nocardiopsis aegyptia]NYJ33772.1 signal transduction histidine kinase [Nocardiopsis aegyptia]
MHQPVHPHNPDPASERDRTTPVKNEDAAPTPPVGPFSGPAENGYRPAARVNVPNPYTRPLKVDDVDTGAHPVGQWRGVGLNEPEPRVVPVRAPESGSARARVGAQEAPAPVERTTGKGGGGDGDEAPAEAHEPRAETAAPGTPKPEEPTAAAPADRKPDEGSPASAKGEPSAPGAGDARSGSAAEPRTPGAPTAEPGPAKQPTSAASDGPKPAAGPAAPAKGDAQVSAPAEAREPRAETVAPGTPKAEQPTAAAPADRKPDERAPAPAKGDAQDSASVEPGPAKQPTAVAPVDGKSVPPVEPTAAKAEASGPGAGDGRSRPAAEPRTPSAPATSGPVKQPTAPADRKPAEGSAAPADRKPAERSPAPAAGAATAEPAGSAPRAPAPTVPPLRPARPRTRTDRGDRAGATADPAPRAGDTAPTAPDHTSTDDRSGRHGTRSPRVPAGQDGARPPEGAPPMADHTHTPSDEPGEQHERHRPHAADAPMGHQAADHTGWGHRPTGPAGPQAPGRPHHTYDEQGWRGPHGQQPAPPSPGRQGYQVPQEPTGLPQPPAGYGHGPQQYPPAPDPRGPWQDGQQPHGYPPPYPYGAYQQAVPPPPQPMPQYPVPYPAPHPIVTYQSAYPAPFQPPGYVLPGQPVVYPAPYQAHGQPIQHVIVLTPGQPPQVLTAEPVQDRSERQERQQHPERDDRSEEHAREGIEPAERPKALPRPEAPEAAAPSAPAPEAPKAESAPAVESAPAPDASASAIAEETEKILNEALAGLAMRDLSLVDALLEMVEELETDAKDPDLLDKLFQIDNFATRMRRNGENLLVLTGHDGGESDAHDEIVPLLDVARAATSEIKDYPRVRLGKLPQTSITGMAADDISHLLAELLDNATANSPEHSQVVISAREMDDGRLMMIVEDEGVGIPEHQLGELNERLSGSPRLDDDVPRHMGLYVASRIGRKHGLETRLESRAFRGVNAYTIIPKELLRVATPPTPGKPRTSAVPSTSGPSVGTGSQALTPPPVTGTNGVNGSSASKPTNGGDPSVTAAGLPRRSATPHGSPLRMMPHPKSVPPPSPPSDKPKLTGDARAEQIRDELGDFLDGEREAREESGGEEGGTT